MKGLPNSVLALLLDPRRGRHQHHEQHDRQRDQRDADPAEHDAGRGEALAPQAWPLPDVPLRRSAEKIARIDGTSGKITSPAMPSTSDAIAFPLVPSDAA